jgi:hypothetical protein
MTIPIVRIEIVIVVDPILIAGVVGRIDIDAADPSRESYAKPSQRIEIITFNYKVTPRRGAFAELKIEGARDKIGVDGLVSFNLVTFPDEAEFLGSLALF